MAEACFSTVLYPALMARTVLATDLGFKYEGLFKFYPKIVKEKGFKGAFRGLELHILYRMISRLSFGYSTLMIAYSAEDLQEMKNQDDYERKLLTEIIFKYMAIIITAEVVSYPI